MSPKKVVDYNNKKSRILNPEFAETRIVGDTAKEFVRVLLERADYSVYPFGYESFLTHVKDLVYQGKLEKSPVIERLRSMPDFSDRRGV